MWPVGSQMKVLLAENVPRKDIVRVKLMPGRRGVAVDLIHLGDVPGIREHLGRNQARWVSSRCGPP